MAYRDFKDLLRRTAADKLLHDKAFNIGNNPKHDVYQGGLTSMACKFSDKMTSDGAIKSDIMPKNNWLKNYTNQLLENLKNGNYTHLL